MRTVRAIEVIPVRLPVIAELRFAGGSAGAAGMTAPHVFVKVSDSSGEIGWGEARPSPQWSSETFETVASTIRGHLAPALIGLPLRAWREAHRRMDTVIARGPSTGQPIAKAALDIALHDLAARAAGHSLRWSGCRSRYP